MFRLILAAAFFLVLPLQAADVAPPKGFTALFNGKDLSGWHVLPSRNPEALDKLNEAERKAQIEKWTSEAKKHVWNWGGVLRNDGPDFYLTNDHEYGDIELLADIKGPTNLCLRDRGVFGGGGYGSGGDWKQLRIIQVGERTSVTLDGKPISTLLPLHVTVKGRAVTPRKGKVQFQMEKGTSSLRNVFVREISGAEANDILRKRDAEGFKDVFNGKDFTGWAGPLDNYEVVEGAIVCKPKKGGVIFTKEEYTDFVVRLEYRVPPGGNNGLALRYPGKGQASVDAMCEIQVLDDDAPKYAKLDPRQSNGSAYGMAAAHKGYQRAVGEWNFMEVTVKGPTIQVEVNGTRTMETDLSKVKEFMGGKPHPGKDRTSGNFGFCGHNDPVAFRAIQIKRLP